MLDLKHNQAHNKGTIQRRDKAQHHEARRQDSRIRDTRPLPFWGRLMCARSEKQFNRIPYRAQIRATDKASQASIERSVAWLFAFALSVGSERVNERRES